MGRKFANEDGYSLTRGNPGEPELAARWHTNGLAPSAPRGESGITLPPLAEVADASVPERDSVTAKPAKQPKFAPAREDGAKPFVLSAYSFGKTTDTIVWANTAADAKYAGYRGAYTTYTARRATPADVALLGE